MADETRRDPACRPHAHPCSSEWPNRPSCGGFAPRLARRLSCRTTSHAVTMPVGTENARTHCTASRPSLRVVDQTSCIEDRESPPLGPANFRAQATAGGSPNFVGPGRHASGNSSWVGSPFFFFLTRPMPLLERGRLGEQEREEARASVRSSWSVAPSRPVPSRLFRRRRVNRKEKRKQMAPARDPLGVVAVVALVVAIFMPAAAAAAAQAPAPAPTSDGAYPIFLSLPVRPHCGISRVTLWFLSRSGRTTDRRPSLEAAGCGTERCPAGLDAPMRLSHQATSLSALPSCNFAPIAVKISGAR
jgi:hypothetical protein